MIKHGQVSTVKHGRIGPIYVGSVYTGIIIKGTVMID